MAKTLGLDLGTNSIGWAIRDTEAETENQIIDSGVVIFKKGVGEGKSGEYSLAAERRTHRSKRRLYNAKRYRKWATLKVLIDNNMCPLSETELRLWSVGEWKEVSGNKKNTGRKYPMSPEFMQWIRMDFDGDGKLDYENPYQLRCELLEKSDELDKHRLYKIGRAFYHLVQRRGFKSSRKSGKSAYGENEYFAKIREHNPQWEAAQIWQSGLENEGRRIRSSGVLQRVEYEKEFFKISEVQKLGNELTERVHKAIYYVRPLRTQKGLVGKCTLEKGKARIPVSHPMFEEFRAISFINNLKWRKAGTYNAYEQVPIDVRKAIFEKLFFRVSKPYFKFDEIIDEFSKKGEYEFNFKNKPNVSACPVIAQFKSVFKEEWEDCFIADKDKIGINWSGLVVKYSVKYGKKAGAARELKYEELWHLLFDFIQTKDDEKALEKFLTDVVGWDGKKAHAFKEISIEQGYGSLSKTAIAKILPFLQEGYIYSEAVSFANLKQVLGNDLYELNKNDAKALIAKTIKEVEFSKERLNIVNGLIQQFFGEGRRCDDSSYQLSEYDKSDIEVKLNGYFGTSNWEKFDEEKRESYIKYVGEKYLSFIRGEQPNELKASYGKNDKKPKNDYYKLPRLDESIKLAMKQKFGAQDDKLKLMYHPSDIEIYPAAKFDDELGVLQLGEPMPPSKGWKNPMALRTMHELKKLVNYLLEVGKIDTETRVVVEMARELNDANKRWAIETYQRKREEENIEFAKAILGVAKVKYPNLNENDADNIDKVRLWWEQLENGEDVYKEVKALKEDVKKYKLWKEQECQCVYTGKMIGITDLFEGTKFDFEHTLHISESFDNSLANLTVCDADYNRKLKSDRIPFECPNYNSDSNGYTAILPRIQKWIDKRNGLWNRIEENRIRAKKTQDPETIKTLIRARHLLMIDYEYWKKKVQTFTLKEMPSWWKNSQLVDTQIITKYARAYMKTVFSKVEVQKGSVTANFRKIYGVMGEEKKDRGKHSHHAADAAVLTLIPGSASRDAILKEYYQAKERKEKYHKLPYEKFDVKHVKDIEKGILVYHTNNDQTLSETKKKVRKRGKVVYLKDKITKKYILDKDGKRIPMRMQGDTIRGQLFEETFYGAIKEVQRNENGYPERLGDGKFSVLKDKDGNDIVKYVVREPLIYKGASSIAGFKNLKDLESQIVDRALFEMIKNQVQDKDFKSALEEGVWMYNKKGERENKIRHVRIYCSVNPVPIKKHTDVFKSIQKHKEDVLAVAGDNSFYLLYESVIGGKIKRKHRVYKLFDVASIKKGASIDFEKNISIGKNEFLPLRGVIKTGTKLLLFNESKIELEELNRHAQEELSKRIFVVRKYRADDGRIYCQNHIEARDPDTIKKEFGDYTSKVDLNAHTPWIVLSLSNFKFLIEDVDFVFKSDGTISFIKTH